MKDYEALLMKINDQEMKLQFDHFSNDMAHEIGLMLLEVAKKNNKPVAIDITRNGHQLFHVALDGSTPDNDAWIQRKMRVVNRFSHSSYYMSVFLENLDRSIEEVYLLDEREYAPHGGSFPIKINDTGVIGTITVSGLPSAEDHQMVVDVLSDYLGVHL